MIAIATPDKDAALRLGKLIEGRRVYILGPSAEAPIHAGTAEDEARHFRHAIHSAQPSVIVLDVRVGKSHFKVLDQVSRLLEIESKPAIILLLPFESRAVKLAASEMGCYAAFIIDRRRAYEAKVAQAVVDAEAARHAGALPRRGAVH